MSSMPETQAGRGVPFHPDRRSRTTVGASPGRIAKAASPSSAARWSYIWPLAPSGTLGASAAGSLSWGCDDGLWCLAAVAAAWRH
jgi:hypothetical protein